MNFLPSATQKNWQWQLTRQAVSGYVVNKYGKGVAKKDQNNENMWMESKWMQSFTQKNGKGDKRKNLLSLYYDLIRFREDVLSFYF